jgi:hypothetical protein
MKSFASPSFFRLLDLLLSTTNPGLKLSRWKFDGVEFERERHSVMGPKHGLAIEIFTLTHAGRRGWTLMVTKEYWWAGEESKALKNLRWARRCTSPTTRVSRSCPCNMVSIAVEKSAKSLSPRTPRSARSRRIRFT